MEACSPGAKDGSRPGRGEPLLPGRWPSAGFPFSYNALSPESPLFALCGESTPAGGAGFPRAARTIPQPAISQGTANAGKCARGRGEDGRAVAGPLKKPASRRNSSFFSQNSPLFCRSHPERQPPLSPLDRGVRKSRPPARVVAKAPREAILNFTPSDRWQEKPSTRGGRCLFILLVKGAGGVVLRVHADKGGWFSEREARESGAESGCAQAAPSAAQLAALVHSGPFREPPLKGLFLSAP